MSTPKSFKVAFIGSGAIALTHMKYLSEIPGVKIVAAADVSRDALEKARTAYAIPNVYSDWNDLLTTEFAIDAVDVCTPNALHAPAAIAALHAGHHVMVEKPMAMNATEAKAMLDASKKAGKHLIVGFQHRFEPRTKLIRDQIQSGDFGKILYVRCQALRRRGIPNWGVFGRKELQGGGPMIDIGVHVIEMAHYAIGSPRPITATGNTWTYLGNYPSHVQSQWPGWDHKTYNVEDLAVGMIRFDTGTMMTIEASFVAHIEKDIWSFQVMGTKGGAVWDTSQIFMDHGGYMMNATPAFLGHWDHFQYKMRHFVDVCRDGRESEAPAEHGLMVQKMLDGVYASAAAGREVRIDE
jgi:predicted dehydrogenase